MNWDDYVSDVVKRNSILDNVELYFDGQNKRISPIIKASVLMLEDMIKAQGKHNVFVFPEAKRLIKEFLVAKVINNIDVGKIKMNYDPKAFQLGQTLTYKKCFFEFEKVQVDKLDGIEKIYIKFAKNAVYGIPTAYAPLFQIAESKKLSRMERFLEVFSAKNALKELSNPNKTIDVAEVLESNKTHLTGSIFYVSAIKETKEFFEEAKINNRSIEETLYLARVNNDGGIVNLTPGQFAGNPAIVLVPDLYTLINAINKGANIQSIVFDASQPNSIDKQLDAFDQLMAKEYPLVCVTNTINSFDLSPLIDRQFNLWRWDSDSITSQLFSSSDVASNRIKNCKNQKIEYINAYDDKISVAVKLLYKHKGQIEEQSTKVMAIYDYLFSVSFTLLRNDIPLADSERAVYLEQLNTRAAELGVEKRFMPKELYDDFALATNSLIEYVESVTQNAKHEIICDALLSQRYESICIVIPERLDRNKSEYYWNSLSFPNRIKVMYPQEYCDNNCEPFDLVIISGWFSNKAMRSIIFNFHSENYWVLTYPCEERWKTSHTKQWARELNNSANATIVEKSLSKTDKAITKYSFDKPYDKSLPVIEDELQSIETTIMTTKYKRYGSGAGSQIVEAYPISFVGGKLAFYRTGHSVIDATDIILGSSNQIKYLTPDKLEVGSFIVIRESDKDIIREIADKLLENSGLSKCRAQSSRWRDSLKVESIFYSAEDLHKRLIAYGCKKDFATVRNWLQNEDMIMPKDKDDLLAIAAATDDEVLLENIDSVYEAGKVVRTAHVKAGNILSKRLSAKLSEHLSALGAIDSYNIWDPIELQIEDVGTVVILKIIDIGTVVSVDIYNPNRLISE